MRKVTAFQSELRERGLRPERLLIFSASGASRSPLVLGATVPGADDALRLQEFLEASARGSSGQGTYVLYWMMSNRRMVGNAGLAVASALARATGRPLLIVEALASTYPWASERHHAFVLQGAFAHARTTPGYLFVPMGKDPGLNADARASFVPDTSLLPERCYDAPISRAEDVANARILPTLFAHACAVVTDWNPSFIFPALASRGFKALRRSNPAAPFLLVDDCGIVPTACYAKPEAAARFIRPKLVPFLQGCLAERDAIADLVAQDVARIESMPTGVRSTTAEGEGARFVLGTAVGRTDFDDVGTLEETVAFSGVSRQVRAVAARGGEDAAHARLATFLAERLDRYAEDRNHPDRAGTSRLSPYLHYGMIHPRDVVAAACAHRGVPGPADLPAQGDHAKFIDELVTWRELGFNMARFAFDAGVALGAASLIPKWALDTLRKHPPETAHVIPLARLEEGRGDDPVWNAAQNELLRTGVIHNYMRMLWGKGVVRWSRDPEDALRSLDYLNNKYALDGRDVNSYTGIYWCLGKFDRPWPPARAPFGLVRKMSTTAAQKKLAMRSYLENFGRPS